MVAARIAETIVDDGGRASGVAVDAGVPTADTNVDARDAARSVVESAAMERTGVKAAAVKATRVNSAVEPAAMAAATVSPSKGEVWLAERSNAQHGSCRPSQSPSYPGPGSIFA
jgi:N-acetylglutamate synthase/N-acetylornithine aminotransferase